MLSLRTLFCAFLVSILLSSCSSLQRPVAGLTPESAIVLDTLDFPVDKYLTLPLQPTAERIVDLKHMELDLKFNLEEQSVVGVATLQVSAYLDNLDSVYLDARGFKIESIQLKEDSSISTLHYNYDGSRIGIAIQKPIGQTDTASIIISYEAFPAKLDKGNGAAITSNQGLYFINPSGKVEGLPQQVWSQGETEYNSGWFPCIDKPQEKFTQEIYLTVDSSFKTISNGRLVYSAMNEDGTRTDYWKQEKPHSAYLTMIAIGEFTLVKDEWRDIPVWYYVDADFEAYAMDIFGNTPEMLEFYSRTLGVDYPWEKYHQVIVKDFVSGAMENTSAVIHGDFVQQTPRQMLDGTHEDVIAHELFHHWFGDLVTCESWSQIVLNEGFATYGEYLWIDYKYGRDEAAFHLNTDLLNYLYEAEEFAKPLERLRYNQSDDVFDSHSYQKGGRVLHLLRKEVGDKVFFKTLQHYLTRHAYGTTEIADLRLAFEEVSGRDLRWFFDQWFEEKGHPQVTCDYRVDQEDNILFIDLEQVQRVDYPTFRFTVDLAVGLEGGEVRTIPLSVDQAAKSFAFPFEHRILWYDLDPEGDMLWQVKENRPEHALLSQLAHGNHAFCKEDAINSIIISGREHPFEFSIAFQDQAKNALFWHTREQAILGLLNCKHPDNEEVVKVLSKIAVSDNKSDVRNAALIVLDSLTDQESFPADLFIAALQDSSYMVIRTALSTLVANDPCGAKDASSHLQAHLNASIAPYISKAHSICADPASVSFFKSAADQIEGLELFIVINDFADFATACNSEEIFSSLVDILGAKALDDNSWWARYAAAQGLKQALVFYDQALEKTEALPEENETRVERIAALKNKKANISAIIDEIEELQLDQENMIRH